MGFDQDPEYRWYDCNLQTYKIKCDELTVGKITQSPVRTFVYEGTMDANTTKIQITSAMLYPVNVYSVCVGRISVWAFSGTSQCGELVYIFSSTGNVSPYKFNLSSNTDVNNFQTFKLEVSSTGYGLFLTIDPGSLSIKTFKLKYEGF